MFQIMANGNHSVNPVLYINKETCKILEYRRNYLYLCKYLGYGRKNCTINEIQLLGGEFY